MVLDDFLKCFANHCTPTKAFVYLFNYFSKSNAICLCQIALLPQKVLFTRIKPEKPEKLIIETCLLKPIYIYIISNGATCM